MSLNPKHNKPRRTKERQELIKYINTYYHKPMIKKDRVIFYHGTPHYNIPSIKRSGLIGGYNTIGGTHGVFEKPRLYLTNSKYVAAKYGTVIEVEIPLDRFKEFDDKIRVSTDGLGDRVYIIEGNDNEVLIPSEYLRLPEEIY